MTEQDRRDFLKRLAKAAVYAAPVVHSLAAPADVLGQSWTEHHPKTSGLEQQPQQQPTTTTQPGGEAPWQREPPGGDPPGSPRRR